MKCIEEKIIGLARARMGKPYKATALIFTSRKAVVAGLKSSKQIKPTIQKLANIVKTYK